MPPMAHGRAHGCCRWWAVTRPGTADRFPVGVGVGQLAVAVGMDPPIVRPRRVSYGWPSSLIARLHVKPFLVEVGVIR
jgi:hypothetical protein